MRRRAQAKMMLAKKPIFPSLGKSVAIRSPLAHRILKRPYSADVYLTETLQMVILHRNSITQKIQNSSWFSQRFQRHVQDMQSNPVPSAAGRLRNLSAAKHRLRNRGIWGNTASSEGDPKAHRKCRRAHPGHVCSMVRSMLDYFAF